MTKLISEVKNRDSDHFHFKMVAVPIFVLVLSFFTAVQAEVAIVSAPLTWGPDKLGEYLLPALSGGRYATDQFVATKGQVSAITMNWESKGKIEMEVSADNGLHYTPVVNGVPLKSGFVNGDRIRWRAKALSDDAQLISVKISYTDTSGVKGDFGEPLLSGYQYRKAFSIKNNSAEDLYNYQLKLRIGESELTQGVGLNTSARAKDDFSDLRFTATDTQTILPYYLENIEGESPNRVAVVWVKIPQVLKGSLLKLYLYYGNSEAEGISDGNKTFDFFDDFKASALDQDKWVIHIDKNGSQQLNGGLLKLDAAEVITKDYIFKEGIVEYSAEVASGFENSLNLRNKNNNSYDIPNWVAYSSAYKGAEHCIALDGIVKSNDATATPTVAGGKYDYRLGIEGGNFVFARYGYETKEKEANVTYKVEPAAEKGYLSLRSGGDGSGRNIIYFGSVRVRKSAALEPEFASAGKEELITLPVFVNTTLSAKGNLILSPGVKSGYYIPQDIFSDEPVRIMIPDWSTEPFGEGEIKIKISADKGTSYQSECERGRFYYASKKDFTAGHNLKVRLDFSIQDSGRLNVRYGGGGNGGLSEFSLDYRPGKITVISPNGGESWVQGTKKEIVWSALEYERSYPFNIAYSSDAGKNYEVVTDKAANTGKFLWNVPDKPTKKAKIKITDTLSYDTSDKVFSIVSEEPEAEKQLQEALPEETIEGKIKEEDLQALIEAKERPGTELYDIVIKLGDNVSANAQEDSRACYKEGDIVVVRPAGHVWSETERASFLIVQAYLTAGEAAKLTMPYRIDTGRVDESGRPIMETLRRRAKRIDLSKLGFSKGLQVLSAEELIEEK
ncbi:MAG: DUF2341 domain-containing protein [Candidatus Omnitrophica bacterium]|nr:DUF2341 domain-containing protein [Candidatus Omnitrophota bacterium]